MKRILLTVGMSTAVIFGIQAQETTKETEKQEEVIEARGNTTEEELQSESSEEQMMFPPEFASEDMTKISTSELPKEVHESFESSDFNEGSITRAYEITSTAMGVILESRANRTQYTGDQLPDKLYMLHVDTEDGLGILYLGSDGRSIAEEKVSTEAESEWNKSWNKAYGETRAEMDEADKALEEEVEQAEANIEEAADETEQALEESVEEGEESIESAAYNTEETVENAAYETEEAIERTSNEVEEDTENAEESAEGVAKEMEQTAEKTEENIESAAYQAEESAENAAKETEETVESAAYEAEEEVENAATKTEETMTKKDGDDKVLVVGVMEREKLEAFTSEFESKGLKKVSSSAVPQEVTESFESSDFSEGTVEQVYEIDGAVLPQILESRANLSYYAGEQLPETLYLLHVNHDKGLSLLYIGDDGEIIASEDM